VASECIGLQVAESSHWVENQYRGKGEFLPIPKITLLTVVDLNKYNLDCQDPCKGFQRIHVEEVIGRHLVEGTESAKLDLKRYKF